jgi:hypothetical protein
MSVLAVGHLLTVVPSRNLLSRAHCEKVQAASAVHVPFPFIFPASHFNLNESRTNRGEPDVSHTCRLLDTDWPEAKAEAGWSELDLLWS